jgi:hypothetical protein
MLTFAVMVWWFGLTISAAAIVGASLAQNGVSLFTWAVRGWMRERIGAGLSAGRRVDRTARTICLPARPNLAGELLRSGALKRVV